MPVAANSVVQVVFPGYGRSLAYYNDRFDLHVGDRVYVEGKFEGNLGRVTEVNRNFKINLSYYKRVINRVDTRVQGQFFRTDGYLLTFDKTALPPKKVRSWFKAPHTGGEKTVFGSDSVKYPLDTLSGLNFSPDIAKRGVDYFESKNVLYMHFSGKRVYALVQGSDVYEVEFNYENGELSSLTCSCYCACNCKHEFAVLLQLRELLKFIEKRYAVEFRRFGAFSVMEESALLSFALGENSATESILFN